MCDIESLRIDLRGLSDGNNAFAFDLDDAYFEAIDAPEVRHGSVRATLTIDKLQNFFDLTFHVEGTVSVPCDICLDDMEQVVVGDSRLTARFGEENSADDDVVTVAEDEGILDTSWLIYELIALNIPIKHVHAPGKCNPAMIKALEEHSADRSSDAASTNAIDPRLEALLKLKK